MLERDWVLAFAHVRGGGERGKAWHAAGRGLKKWNSFWDFEVWIVGGLRRALCVHGGGQEGAGAASMSSCSQVVCRRSVNVRERVRSAHRGSRLDQAGLKSCLLGARAACSLIVR